MVKRTFLEPLNDIYTVMTRLMLRRLMTDNDFINSLLVRGVSIKFSRHLLSSTLPCLTTAMHRNFETTGCQQKLFESSDWER
jgi:hypothetical protein